MENNYLVWSLSVTEAKFSHVRFLLDNKVWTLLGNTASFIFSYANQKLLLAVGSWPVATKVAQALGTVNMMIALHLYYKSLYGNITLRIVQYKRKIITSTYFSCCVYNLRCYGVWKRFRTMIAGFSFSVFLSIYIWPYSQNMPAIACFQTVKDQVRVCKLWD